MTSITRFSLGALAASALLWTSTADAQRLSAEQTPAEFPPESYTANQYVDSRGCIYVRAGVDGSPTWVPRVNRDREHLCGFTPSLAQEQQREAPRQTAETETDQRPAPEPRETAQAPEQIRPDREDRPDAERNRPETAQDRASAQIRTADQARPSDQDRRETDRPENRRPAPPQASGEPIRTVASIRARSGAQIARPVSPRPAPAPADAAKARPAPEARAEAQAGASCPGVSPLSARFIRSPDGIAMRCGPQDLPPYTIRGGRDLAELPEGTPVYRFQPAAADGGAPARVYRSVSGRPVSGDARVLPRHLWQPGYPAEEAVEMPEGFRPAWEDGRLNPRRAEQSLDGRARMRLIWTDSVPRRLIDRSTGQDVTADHPRLFYPFTDMATQRTYLASKDSLRVLRSADGRVKLEPRDGAPQLSTRATPQPEPARPQPAREPRASAPAHRFVQVGTFGVPDNAQRTAARLQALGLPARIARMSRGGRNLQVVMAGPFDSRQALGAALDKARQAGFGDAFPRN